MTALRPSRCAAALTGAACVLAAGCGRGPAEPAAESAVDRFDGDRALRHVAGFVALGPKDAGTEGAARAAAWIAGQVEAVGGWEVGTDEFTDDAPGGPLVFRNVTARRPGQSKGIVLFGAHYDTKAGIPDFEGANDSGSGVGVLLELARLVSDSMPPFEIRLAFFDGEECRVAYGPRDGLHGSRRMARRAVDEGWARRVRAVIILDMVGDRDWTLALPRNCAPHLLQLTFDAARDLGLRDRVRLARGAVLDDHVPFHEAGIPAVNLIDFEFGSAPGLNDLWHTPADSMDAISADSLANAGRLALRLLDLLAASDP